MGKGKFAIDKHINEVTLKKQSSAINLSPSISLSFYIGQTSNYLVFLESSSIMHVFSNEYPFEHLTSAILNS
jgi:hypothetical protein